MEELKPLSEASSPEEFKALREQHRKASESAAEPKEPPSPASAKASETVADSEPAKPKTQEKEEKPKGERTLESRIAQLRANGKHGEADAILRKTWEQQSNERFDKLEKELQEYRLANRQPSQQPPRQQLRPPQRPRRQRMTDLNPRITTDRLRARCTRITLWIEPSGRSSRGPLLKSSARLRKPPNRPSPGEW